MSKKKDFYSKDYQNNKFVLNSDFKPTGDQPEAINRLVEGINRGDHEQTLMGVTGSGKTFTMANVIELVQKPTLVIAQNKTLAGQLTEEFRTFFPNNAVEYFVSYYDYYQPEAYIPGTDTYIEKDSSINDEIDRMRHSATASLLERRDVIVVASVSCIYGLGNPEDYSELMLHLRSGMRIDRDELIAELVRLQYSRNDYELLRGTFRVKGDTVDIHPVNYENTFLRVSFFGDEIDQMLEMDRLSNKVLLARHYESITPASHYATTEATTQKAIKRIEAELEDRLTELRDEGKIVEAYRLEQRTRYDIEMLEETGFVKGIENYSRHFSERKAGDPPNTLIDFFPDDFLLMIDESHVTIPQIGGMAAGDRSRKNSLVDFGFRLPSAYDNRPLTAEEFFPKINQAIYVSATPGKYERAHSSQMVEQIIRPTGLVDPEISIRPISGQIEDLLGEIKATIARGERALIMTLTKRMAEDFTDFLQENGIKVQYLHSDVVNDERLAILRNLRSGKIDVIVGINLLREGLDLPEVSLIAILDADKEGFLRSTTSLIQIIGRAARNVNGKVIMYGDKITDSMFAAVQETNRRREIQEAYNKEHNITPQTIKKEIKNTLDTFEEIVNTEDLSVDIEIGKDSDSMQDKIDKMPFADLQKLIDRLEDEMRQAAAALEFENAAELRDLLIYARGAMARK
ncbi:excinuclease ABC subunit UvrB [Fastidiosipila sanguinis]|uniref:excinuclease ABC subunit UvrB n=1 Tax=Fastidiosipila sanguinis TaxID=236753 RepID=UPI001FA8338A|nr:excinuclease ABC subunit UvrB [Fastidiosipila sanguinis]